MGLSEIAKNPWIYFLPVAFVGFLGIPPWSYPTIPVNQIGFGLRSAFEGISSYSTFCPSTPHASQIMRVNETVPDESELAAFAIERDVQMGGSWKPPDCRLDIEFAYFSLLCDACLVCEKKLTVTND